MPVPGTSTQDPRVYICYSTIYSRVESILRTGIQNFRLTFIIHNANRNCPEFVGHRSRAFSHLWARWPTDANIQELINSVQNVPILTRAKAF